MSDFDGHMVKLRARFIIRTREDRGRLADAWQRGDRAVVKQLAHGLSGSAGIFGFPEISSFAGAVEDAIDEGLANEELRFRCAALLEKLHAASQAD